MSRVLIFLKDLRVGNGIASCIMSYYDAIIANGFKVDFLLLQDVASVYIEKAKQNGNIYILPESKKKYSVATNRFLSKLFVNNTYDIVHVNIPGPYGAWILKKAKANGVNHRIYHSHNPKNNLSLKSRVSSSIYNRLCVKRATDYLACSNDAGVSIFGKRDFTVLKNCIDVQRFAFDDAARLRLRNEQRISNSTVVVGSVGRLEEQKNPLFAIECFSEYLKLNKDALYVWVGDGSLTRKAKEYVVAYQLSEYVRFVGVKSNIEEWYSMMDYFLLPSKFEGLGIVYIEAQASGLPCFGSTQVPKDTEITFLMHRMDLESGEKAWARNILNYEKNSKRLDGGRLVKESGYDINSEYGILLNYYAKLIQDYAHY